MSAQEWIAMQVRNATAVTAVVAEARQRRQLRFEELHILVDTAGCFRRGSYSREQMAVQHALEEELYALEDQMEEEMAAERTAVAAQAAAAAAATEVALDLWVQQQADLLCEEAEAERAAAAAQEAAADAATDAAIEEWVRQQVAQARILVWTPQVLAAHAATVRGGQEPWELQVQRFSTEQVRSRLASLSAWFRSHTSAPTESPTSSRA